MSDLLGNFQLPSPEYDCPIDVRVYKGVEEQVLNFIATEWMPILRTRQNEAIVDVMSNSFQSEAERMAAGADALSRKGAPDGHWDWRRKMETSRETQSDVAFFVASTQGIEAIMDCTLAHSAREPTQLGEPTVYVRHVAVAPWNRSQIQTPRRIAKLGDLMIGTAISLSLEEGFEGRVGLHSLLQAEGFYHFCGMTDLGPDQEYEGLRYFEFTPAQAKAVLT